MLKFKIILQIKESERIIYEEEEGDEGLTVEGNSINTSKSNNKL